MDKGRASDNEVMKRVLDQAGDRAITLAPTGSHESNPFVESKLQDTAIYVLLARAADMLTIQAMDCTFIVCNPMGAPRRRPGDHHADNCPRQILVNDLLKAAVQFAERIVDEA